MAELEDDLCKSCGGTGLRDNFTLCPVCGGTPSAAARAELAKANEPEEEATEVVEEAPVEEVLEPTAPKEATPDPKTVSGSTPK